ncbi:MAG TPA: hypothetical protein VFU90_10965 [Candidatus Tumulicola sp.]|nr:hypothetical protein [Candidatus Tumulicola sp.]
MSAREQTVYAVRLIRVANNSFARLYGEIASFMEGPGSEIFGCREIHLYGNEANSEILIVSEYVSCRDWSHAQWDQRLGELLEEIVVNSETIHFGLYTGHHRFLARHELAAVQTP